MIFLLDFHPNKVFKKHKQLDGACLVLIIDVYASGNAKSFYSIGPCGARKTGVASSINFVGWDFRFEDDDDDMCERRRNGRR